MFDEVRNNIGRFNEYVGETILVTGGGGCIGGNLCKKLSELDAHKVIILDNLSPLYKWNIPQADNIELVNGDVLNDEDLIRILLVKDEKLSERTPNQIESKVKKAMGDMMNVETELVDEIDQNGGKQLSAISKVKVAI